MQFGVRLGHGQLADATASTLRLDGCEPAHESVLAALGRHCAAQCWHLRLALHPRPRPSSAAGAAPEAVRRDGAKPRCVTTEASRTIVLKGVQQNRCATRLLVAKVLGLRPGAELAFPNSQATQGADLEMAVDELPTLISVHRLLTRGHMRARRRWQPCCGGGVRLFRWGHNRRRLAASVKKTILLRAAITELPAAIEVSTADLRSQLLRPNRICLPS
mmetsp:Transcript_66055/g.214872  ORF Transcript_66055/g.214872 Transcript_66055/m.214872 type:complete len:218 (+) Transcript_66055:1012-1665(+)